MVMSMKWAVGSPTEAVAQSIPYELGLVRHRLTRLETILAERSKLVTTTLVKEWYTGEEAAAYLGITMHALRRLVQRGRLKKAPGSYRYRFRKSTLDAYLEGKR